MVRRIGTLLLAASLAGCGVTFAGTYQRWVGREQDELIARMGAPDQTAPLSNGGRVLTWTTTYNKNFMGGIPEMAQCRRTFVVDAAGKVTDWSLTNCASLDELAAPKPRG